ncbi:MAG: hypothetical protein V3R85_06145 [Alphaproteobacteria bacterium]
MTPLRYPPAAIRGDFARGGAGLALSLGPLYAVPPTSAAGLVLGGLAILFAIFGMRTWARQRMAVTLDTDSLLISGFSPKKVAWGALSALEMRYYTTRKARDQGWMQVTLRSEGVVVRLDSTLDGFPAIVRRAAAAAAANGVALSPATQENLGGFGVPAEHRR